MTEVIHRVSEIFGPTLQGEGAQIGRPTVFVRFGGCDYRCSWCDSLYAVLPEHRVDWRKMRPSDILADVRLLTGGRPILITLSGGNPALQPLQQLIEVGHHDGHSFTMETQGSVAKDWFGMLDHLCLSPKPPSSGMPTDYGALEACLKGGPRDTILKVVVFDEKDFSYAQLLYLDYPHVDFYLQVGNANVSNGPEDLDRLRETWLTKLDQLSQWVIAAGMNRARVLPQLHVLLWGNKRAV